MDSDTDSIDVFFINNKVMFDSEDMPKNIMAISFLKNDVYWLIVNNLYDDYKKDLIDVLVDITANNFFENKKMGIYAIKI